MICIESNPARLDSAARYVRYQSSIRVGEKQRLVADDRSPSRRAGACRGTHLVARAPVLRGSTRRCLHLRALSSLVSLRLRRCFHLRGYDSVWHLKLVITHDNGEVSRMTLMEVDERSEIQASEKVAVHHDEW